MAGKFIWQNFSSIDLNDNFFDTLKDDYPDFVDWFHRKQLENKNALVYNDAQGVGAFLYLKRENVDQDFSPLIVNGKELPKIPRLKIGTLRLAERIRKQRLGEGALGVALWYWQETKYEEVYVTVFEKHRELISLFERFGFLYKGKNNRGECVYLKNRHALDYGDPYKAFPFILKDFNCAGILPINDFFHDRLFPYSELVGNNRAISEVTAGNGITKTFLATPCSKPSYKVGMPIFIYRIHTGNGQKAYKSAITSFCTISNIDVIKNQQTSTFSLEEFLQKIGNKSVYSVDELTILYQQAKVLVAIEMVYNGFFGKGHNVIFKELRDNNLFEDYPYNIIYSRNQFTKILELGDVDVQNTIID